MRAFVLAGVAVVAAGCEAVTPNRGPSYSEILEAWVGTPEQELLDRWGAPDETASLAGGGREITFIDRRIEGQRTLECFTTFAVDAGGTLVDYDFEGNDC